jgi:hypothetical protein
VAGVLPCAAAAAGEHPSHLAASGVRGETIESRLFTMRNVLFLMSSLHPDFEGTCYKAPGWSCVGHSVGRRYGVAKAVWVRDPTTPTSTASSGRPISARAASGSTRTKCGTGPAARCPARSRQRTGFARGWCSASSSRVRRRPCRDMHREERGPQIGDGDGRQAR